MKKNSAYYAFGMYGSAGLQIGVAIGGGAWLGQYLDEKFGTGPWLMVVGILLGSAGGFINLMKILRMVENENKETDASDDDDS